MKIVRTGTFTPAMIRMELYAQISEIQELKNTHLMAYGSKHPHGSEECYMCQRFEAEKNGVRRAIKHFGGNPNGGRP